MPSDIEAFTAYLAEAKASVLRATELLDASGTPCPTCGRHEMHKFDEFNERRNLQALAKRLEQIIITWSPR